MISWALAAFKFIATLLGLYKQESELAAGRAEQRDADNKAMDEGRKAAQEVKREAVKKHAADPTDDAFDPGIFRKD